MTPYLFMPIWCAIVAIIGGNKESSFYAKTNDPVAPYKPNFLFACIVFLPIYWLAAWGKPIADTWAYIANFQRIQYILQDGLRAHLSNVQREWGFAAFNYIIYWLSDGSVFMYRSLIGLIHMIPVICIYRRYSCNFLLSFFLFVAAGTYVGWMMNGLRQFMAVTIIFAATPLLIKKQFFLLILIILFASLFHFSALIMLPIIFLVHGQAFNKWTMLSILGAVACTGLFAHDDSLYTKTMSITDYGSSIELLRSLGDYGTSTLRVLVSSIPVILAWINRKKIQETGNVFLNICVNMSVITFAIYLVSSVTSGIMIGRLPVYTSLYGQILLPYLVTRIYNQETSSMLKWGMIICYLCYYPFEVGSRLFG